MGDYYWHFCQVDVQGAPRLGYGDGREVRVGETLTVEGEPELCEHGLHASRRALDALKYTRGNALMLCRVTLGGTVLHDDDKSVATERTVVAMLDTATTERLLREFARWYALQAIHLWDAPEIVRQYLETGDETIRDAARAATWDTTRDAAWDAARVAAWDAAWAATGDAAWAAARAARVAAWGTAWDAQNAQLERMALESISLGGNE